MKRIRAVLFLLAAFFFVGSAPALAWHEDFLTSKAITAGNLWFRAEPDAVAPETVGGITLSALGVTMVISLLLPIATGILTKYNAPPTLKGIVAILVSAVNGVVMGSVAVDGSAHIAKAAVVLAGVSFVIQTATYLGVYQPSDANAKLLPKFGVGPRD